MPANVSVGTVNLVRCEITDRITKAHAEWNGRMLTLSSVALTILFSLRNSYMPQQPVAGWLLPASLVLFTSSILSAVLGCFQQTVCHFKVLRQFNTELGKCLDESRALTKDDLGMALQRARFPNEVRPLVGTGFSLIFFTLAMVALSAFATLNWSY